MKRSKFVGIGVLVLAAQWLFAQSPPASPEAQEKKTPKTPLRVVSRLVQVDVLVTDSKGAPITDLSQKDFKILDAGKEQPISLMDIADARTPRTAVRSSSPFSFSNRIAVGTGARAPTVYVVLFDGLNTQVTDQIYARQNIAKFLNSVRPGEMIAIYVLGSSLRVAHDFTSDLAVLRRTAERLSDTSTRFDPSSPDTAQTSVAAFAEFSAISEKRFEAQMIQDRVKYTLRALEAIAHRLDSVRGRKNLLWVSATFPLAIGLQTPDTTHARLDLLRSFSEDVNRTVRALNDANIAIYPIDSRGLVAPYENRNRLAKEAPEGGPLTQIRRGAASKSSSGSSTSSNGSTADSAAPLLQEVNPFATREVDSTQSTMRQMADLTGGRAFYNTNDLAGSLREAMADSQFTYMLGYYPTHDQWDGRFHEIKVEVARPGTRVRFRQGYFANPEMTFDPASAQGELSGAAQAPLPASAIELGSRFEKDPTGKDYCLMRLRVGPQDISLQKKGDGYTGVVDLLIELADEHGATLWADTQRASLNLKPETYARIQRDGLQFRIQVPVRPGAAEIRMAVQDGATGKYGTLHVPLSAIAASLAN